MLELSRIVKEEADWVFNQEVGFVEPENFDAVYQSVTDNFRLGTICLASKIKNVFEILKMSKDENAIKVLDYLTQFIIEQSDEIETGRRYL